MSIYISTSTGRHAEFLITDPNSRDELQQSELGERERMEALHKLENQNKARAFTRCTFASSRQTADAAVIRADVQRIRELDATLMEALQKLEAATTVRH